MNIRGKTILSTWKESIGILVNCPTIVPTERHGDTYEETNAVLSIESPLNDLDELLAFEKGRGYNYSEEKITTYWKTVNDKLEQFPDTKIDQINIIASKLDQNPYNRHGYASIWTPSLDMVTAYPSCIIGVYFTIREKRLNMTSVLRSNDAWGQALNDMYELTKIQERMSYRLQVKIGEYTHFAMSYHLYMKDHMNALMYLRGLNNAE